MDGSRLVMKEKDIQELKTWLIMHAYYKGNHSVAEELRKLADEWDD